MRIEMSDTYFPGPSELPDRTQHACDFLDSSFFNQRSPQPSLPTPDAVRAHHIGSRPKARARIVKYEDSNLLVKYGPYVKVDEALMMWAVRKTVGDKVPVPEVYGWRIDEGYVFIYMQLIHGHCIKDRWEDLNDSDKLSVCEDLREMIKAIRQFKQPSQDTFIGSISRQGPGDHSFGGVESPHAFKSCKEFSDWFVSLLLSKLPLPKGFIDPWRPYLSDDASIKLTHGDLHTKNIMISSSKPPKVVAILDWEYAGWYPEWWEYCKAIYYSDYRSDWRNIWMPKFLEEYEEVSDYWIQYISAMGA